MTKRRDVTGVKRGGEKKKKERSGWLTVKCRERVEVGMGLVAGGARVIAR